MGAKMYNVLFLCTGNSVRSIIAEAVLNHIGKGQFHAYSAGSHPKGRVNPMALDALTRIGYGTSTLRSKHWDEFAQHDAPKMDFVFTVCDQAAGEICPVFPGQPITAHWGFADPSHVEGSRDEKMNAFNALITQVGMRLRLFTSLPIEKLDRLSLHAQLQAMATS